MPLRPRRALACLTALTVAVAALAGCDSSDGPGVTTSSPPESAATETTPAATEPSSPAASWEASELGVTFTAELPAGWTTDIQNGVSFVRSPATYEGFTANAYLQFERISDGASFESVVAGAKSKLTSMAGWSSSVPDGQRVTVDGKPAFVISGLVDNTASSVPAQLAESMTVVAVDGSSGPVAVYVIGTTHPDDTASKEAIDGLLHSIAFG